MEGCNENTTSTSLIELTDWIWYEVPTDHKNCPSPRQLHTGVVRGDEWFLFGGFAKDAPLDDLWILSLVTKEWKQVKKLLRAWPCTRHSHTATSRSTTNKNGHIVESMIVFGGVTENGEVLNDVWEYSFKKSSWSKLETTGDVPDPRWGHSAIIYHDVLWIFGGFSNTVNNELYSLNLETKKWKKVIREGKPQERHFHSATVYNDKMYILGGVAAGNLGDMFSFHFDSETWESINMTNNITPRRGHQSLLFDHYLIVHGGRDNHKATRDLHLFNFETSSWDTIKVDNTAPSVRYFHSACMWQNAIIVFGGLGVTKNSQLDNNGKVKYSNLNDLYYYSFKGNVFTDIHSINGRFCRLPLDVLKYLLEFMNAETLARLSRVNRFFYFVSSAENLWRRCFYARSTDPNFTQPGSLESAYQAIKTQQTSNNNTTSTTDDVRLDALLSMMRNKMKPDIQQFYWKHHYAIRMESGKGFTWKPSRHQRIIEAGYDAFEQESYREMRVTILGEPGVGKSAICIQYVQQMFVEEYDPTIGESIRKQVLIPGRSSCVMFNIEDSFGYEEYEVLTQQTIRWAHGILIVYSITSRHSFEQAVAAIERVMRAKEQQHQEIPMVLVGNKCDLPGQREVSTAEGIVLAKQYDMPFFEASAKQRVNIEELFYSIMEEIAYKHFAKNSKPSKSKNKDNCTLQ